MLRYIVLVHNVEIEHKIRIVIHTFRKQKYSLNYVQNSEPFRVISVQYYIYYSIETAQIEPNRCTIRVKINNFEKNTPIRYSTTQKNAYNFCTTRNVNPAQPICFVEHSMPYTCYLHHSIIYYIINDIKSKIFVTVNQLPWVTVPLL